jgi:PhnB protein
MRMTTYLSYGGNCEQAFRFYEQQFRGKITSLVRQRDQLDPQNVPA